LDHLQLLVALDARLKHCHHAHSYQLAFVEQTFRKLVHSEVVDAYLTSGLVCQASTSLLVRIQTQ